MAQQGRFFKNVLSPQSSCRLTPPAVVADHKGQQPTC